MARRSPHILRTVAVLAVLALATALLPTGATTRAADPPLVPLRQDQVANRLSGEVFGYLPHWSIRSWTDSYLRYDLLSTIAFFGVGVRDDGSLNTSTAGYTTYLGSTATTIIRNAHTAGVRTVITFESFGFTHNARFLSSPAARARFVQQAVALMARRGADGANIDVELVSGTYFADYGRLIRELATAARARNPIAQISVATNGNTSGARMAAIALANGADLAFLMGYAYRSSGSTPVGAIDPIVRFNGGLSLSASLALYARYGAPLSRVVLGVPYYGMTWPTVSDALHAERQPNSAGLGGGRAFFPSSLTSGTPPGAIFDYDPIEASARLRWFDATKNSWYQTYYNDNATLVPKYRLAVGRDLAGVGIWALGYDRGRSGYWEAIASVFQGPRIRAVSVAPSPTRSTSVNVGIRWVDGAQPTVAVRFSTDGRTWSRWRRVSSSMSYELPAHDGRQTVWAQVVDAGGALSRPRAATAVLDTTRPVMTALSLRSGSKPGTWVIRYAASDALTGVGAYQVRYRIGTGSWVTLRTATTSTSVGLLASSRATFTVSVRARDRAGNWSIWRSVVHRP